jgi:hypothetical protein
MQTYYKDHASNLEKQQQYQKENRDKYRQACKKWRSENPEKQRAAQSRWDKNNPHVNAASAMRYYTRKRQRCPKWLTREHHAQIESFYAEARRLTKETGAKHVVDHIVPLHGETVCGLHVPWNLQVLTATENIRKFNNLDLVAAAGGDSAFATGPGTL